MDKIEYLVKYHPENLDRNGLSDESAEKLKRDVKGWFGRRSLQNGLGVIAEPIKEGSVCFVINGLGLEHAKFGPYSIVEQCYTDQIADIMLHHYKAINDGSEAFTLDSTPNNRNLFKSLFEFEILS